MCGCPGIYTKTRRRGDTHTHASPRHEGSSEYPAAASPTAILLFLLVFLLPRPPVRLPAVHPCFSVPAYLQSCPASSLLSCLTLTPAGGLPCLLAFLLACLASWFLPLTLCVSPALFHPSLPNCPSHAASFYSSYSC